IATTVIEVGVDVPNATVMVIMNSERFGLAQLHQLRGRIGRGEKESACFFTGDIKTEEARIRMETMIGSNDGFAIAERDLELRGPGDFFGTRQHGLPEFHAADIAGDKELMEVSRKDAASVIKKMPSYSALPEVRKAMKLIYSDPAEIIH
ncbi:MAG: DNA helicase RecG, partial [bacterium]|nr:DNA helicase RecG [bacterium]